MISLGLILGPLSVFLSVCDLIQFHRYIQSLYVSLKALLSQASGRNHLLIFRVIDLTKVLLFVITRDQR